METTYTDNGDGTFTVTTTQTAPFDPVATQQQIDSLKAQMAALIELQTTNAQNQFQPQIDALNAQLAAFNQQIPNPS